MMTYKPREPSIALRLSATLMGFVACCCIFLLPSEPWTPYVNMTVTLITGGLFFLSSEDEKSCGKSGTVSLVLGLIWFFNAVIHLMVAIAAVTPKTDITP